LHSVYACLCQHLGHPLPPLCLCLALVVGWQGGRARASSNLKMRLQSPDGCRGRPQKQENSGNRAGNAGSPKPHRPRPTRCGGNPAPTGTGEIEGESEMESDSAYIRRTNKELKSKVVDYRARNKQLLDQCRHLQSELKAISSIPAASEEVKQVRLWKDKVSDLEKRRRHDRMRSEDLRRQIEWLQRNEASRMYRNGIPPPHQPRRVSREVKGGNYNDVDMDMDAVTLDFSLTDCGTAGDGSTVVEGVAEPGLEPGGRAPEEHFVEDVGAELESDSALLLHIAGRHTPPPAHTGGTDDGHSIPTAPCASVDTTMGADIQPQEHHLTPHEPPLATEPSVHHPVEAAPRVLTQTFNSPQAMVPRGIVTRVIATGGLAVPSAPFSSPETPYRELASPRALKGTEVQRTEGVVSISHATACSALQQLADAHTTPLRRQNLVKEVRDFMLMLQRDLDCLKREHERRVALQCGASASTRIISAHGSPRTSPRGSSCVIQCDNGLARRGLEAGGPSSSYLDACNAQHRGMMPPLPFARLRGGSMDEALSATYASTAQDSAHASVRDGLCSRNSVANSARLSDELDRISRRMADLVGHANLVVVGERDGRSKSPNSPKLQHSSAGPPSPAGSERLSNVSADATDSLPVQQTVLDELTRASAMVKQAAQLQRDQSHCNQRIYTHDQELSLIRQRLWQIEKDIAEERRTMLQGHPDVGLRASENSGNTTVAWPSCGSTPSAPTSLRGNPRLFGSLHVGIGSRGRSQSVDYEMGWPPREVASRIGSPTPTVVSQVPTGFCASNNSSNGGKNPTVPPWVSPARSRPSPSGPPLQQHGARRFGSVAGILPTKTLSRASSAPAPVWQALTAQALTSQAVTSQAVASPAMSMAPSLVPSPIRESRTTAPPIPTGVSSMPGKGSAALPQGSSLPTAVPTAAPTPAASSVTSPAGSINAPVRSPEPRTAPTLVLPPRGCPIWVVPQVPTPMTKWHRSWPRRQGPPIQWRVVQQPLEWRA